MSSLADRMQYSRTPLTMEQLQKRVHAAFAQTAHSSRSAKYGFFQTSTVIEAMMKEGFLPYLAEQQYSKTKPDHCRHMVSFRHQVDVSPEGETLPDVCAEVRLVNSHDGTSQYNLYAGLFRKVCDNGLFAAIGATDYISIRHSQKLVNDVIDASYKIIDHSSHVLDTVDKMKHLTMGNTERLAFAEKALDIKFGEKPKTIEAGLLLTTKRKDDEGDDLWTTYNVVQENLIRGRLTGHAATGRQIQTRPIVNLVENIRVNQELYKLALETLA